MSPYKTKVFRITKTASLMDTEMGMEISVVLVVYKVKKKTNSNTPKLFKI